MHAIMKFRMRRRDRYECDVPHPLTLDINTCFALVKINKAEFTKSAEDVKRHIYNDLADAYETS